MTIIAIMCTIRYNLQHKKIASTTDKINIYNIKNHSLQHRLKIIDNHLLMMRKIHCNIYFMLHGTFEFRTKHLNEISTSRLNTCNICLKHTQCCNIYPKHSKDEEH